MPISKTVPEASARISRLIFSSPSEPILEFSRRGMTILWYQFAIRAERVGLEPRHSKQYMLPVANFRIAKTMGVGRVSVEPKLWCYASLMSSKPRNKWISIGLHLFCYFLVLIIASFIFMDVPTYQRGGWGEISTQLLQVLSVGLPLLSLVSFIYGLFKMDGSKESGKIEAVILAIPLAGLLLFYLFNTLF